MPQTMRMRVQTAERARVEPPPARGDEQCVLGPTDEPRTGVAEVQADPVRRLLAERHGALLASLAVHGDPLLVEVDVGEVEIDRFSTAQPGRVDELDEGAVPQRERAVSTECLE